MIHCLSKICFNTGLIAFYSLRLWFTFKDSIHFISPSTQYLLIACLIIDFIVAVIVSATEYLNYFLLYTTTYICLYLIFCVTIGCIVYQFVTKLFNIILNQRKTIITPYKTIQKNKKYQDYHDHHDNEFEDQLQRNTRCQSIISTYSELASNLSELTDVLTTADTNPIAGTGAKNVRDDSDNSDNLVDDHDKNNNEKNSKKRVGFNDTVIIGDDTKYKIVESDENDDDINSGSDDDEDDIDDMTSELIDYVSNLTTLDRTVLTERQLELIGINTKLTILVVFCLIFVSFGELVYIVLIYENNGYFTLNDIETTGVIVVISLCYLVSSLSVWLSFVFANKQYAFFCGCCHRKCTKLFEQCTVNYIKRIERTQRRKYRQQVIKNATKHNSDVVVTGKKSIIDKNGWPWGSQGPAVARNNTASTDLSTIQSSANTASHYTNYRLLSKNFE